MSTPYNTAPSAFFGAGYTATTGSIILGTVDNSMPADRLLTELTDVEANADTGDFRAIVFALMEMLYQKQQAMPVKPVKQTIVRSTYEDPTTGEFLRAYTVQLRLFASSLEVTAEPTIP